MSRAWTTFAALTGIAVLSACGGGGGSTPLPASALSPDVAGAGRTVAGAPIAGCPPAVAGEYAPVTCPDITLKVVGGRTIAAKGGASSPPAGGWALVFAGDGTFLYADDRAKRLRRGAAMELDVLTDPVVRKIESYEWTLWHSAGTTLPRPFIVQLRSVAEIAPNDVVPAETPSFSVSDGTGAIELALPSTTGVDVPLSQYGWLTAAPEPLTLLTFTTQTPQSLCGNCWVALLHAPRHGPVSGSSP